MMMITRMRASMCAAQRALPASHTALRLNSSVSGASNTVVTTTSKIPRASKAINQNQNLRRTDSVNRETYDYKNQHYKLLPCVSISTCESYNLGKSVALLHSHGFKDTSVLIPNEAIHFKFPNVNEKSKSDILVLHTGTVVSYGLDEASLEEQVLPMLAESMLTPYKQESEDMDYVEIAAPGPSEMDGDIICIRGDSESERLLDKAAFAFGLSRSTRLAILEASLEEQILMTKTITEDLSLGRKLTVSGSQVLRSIGRLLLLRAKLNLYSELIEIPDLYWSEPNLEKNFKDISRNLDISPRINILNRKLDYATDEARAVAATLNEDKAVRLEWIIIYLIMIEVFFEIFHFYERYAEKKSDKEAN